MHMEGYLRKKNYLGRYKHSQYYKLDELHCKIIYCKQKKQQDDDIYKKNIDFVDKI